MAVESEWIKEFFEKDTNYGGTIHTLEIGEVLIDGFFSPVRLAIFLNNKISENYSYLE